MLKRLLIALVLCAGTAAVAQVDFNTPTSSINARGTIAMILNGSSQAVPVSSSNPVPISGTITSTPSGTQAVNLTQTNGAAVPLGSGTAAGALRVELPTNGTGVVGLNAGTNNIGNVGLIGPYPTGATAITAASGTAANANAVATLAAAVGKTTYICGFVLSSTGSTAAAVVAPTVAGTITGTLTFAYASVAGVTLANQTMIVPMTPCVPGSAANTAIVVTLPALGAGNTNATANAWGFQL